MAQQRFENSRAEENDVLPEEQPSDGDHLLNGRVTEDEVLKAQSQNLKTDKAGGLDGILPKMLKAGKQITVDFLTSLFNASFEKAGQFLPCLISGG